MKRFFFLLLAAVLLGSASAFAQSGNIEPARGDVNGDGVVDVADINAVIAIMKDGGGAVTVGGYFYLGTTQPTAANYKTLPGVVSTYTSIDDAVGTSVSVAAGETLYMLCPAAWVEEKTVELEDKAENKFNFLDEKDATTISGYVIYKTQVWNAPNDVVLKTVTTYKWHIGTTSPDKTSWSESDFNKTSQSPITSFTAVTSNPFTIWIVPNSWGTVSSMKTGGELRNPWITPVPWNPTLPTGYTAYYTTFSADTPITDITWSNQIK